MNFRDIICNFSLFFDDIFVIFLEVLDVDAEHRVLLDLQPAAELALVHGRVDEVEDHLVVDLEEEADHQVPAARNATNEKADRLRSP